MADPNPTPLAKPSAPAPQADPAGIASSVMKKEGQAPKETDTASRARIEEEVEALDGLPSAAGND